MGVLVTNAEGHIALAVIRSLGRKGLKAASGSERKDALTFHSKYNSAKFAYPSPTLDEDGFIKRLVEIVGEGNFEVIFPADWDVLLPLSKHRDKLTPHTIIPMPPHEIMEKANNKAEFTKIALDNGIPCPKTVFNMKGYSEAELGKELTFPVIIKPYIGAGSEGIVVVESPECIGAEYRKVVEKYGQAIVQEYIQGDPYLFNGLFNKDGDPRRISLIRKIREYPLGGGPTCSGETARRQDIIDLSMRLFKELGYWGFVSTDVIVDRRDNVPKLLDINPRFFGAIAIPMAAGIDYPYLFYRMIKEGDIDKDLQYKVGVKGRSLLVDTRHMLGVMGGKRSPKYGLGRWQTLANYLRFDEYSCDFIISGDDLGPGFSEFGNLLRRKLRV
jgi:predicted ATP-grasp superfamily ATP-dependent carboligase